MVHIEFFKAHIFLTVNSHSIAYSLDLLPIMKQLEPGGVHYDVSRRSALKRSMGLFSFAVNLPNVLMWSGHIAPLDFKQSSIFKSMMISAL